MTNQKAIIGSPRSLGVGGCHQIINIYFLNEVLMENVSLPNEVIDAFKKFKSNYEAANNMNDELLNHAGKFVSIDNGKVLGYTDTYQEAVEKFGSREGVFINLVTEKNIFWIL